MQKIDFVSKGQKIQSLNPIESLCPWQQDRTQMKRTQQEEMKIYLENNHICMQKNRGITKNTQNVIKAKIEQNKMEENPRKIGIESEKIYENGEKNNQNNFNKFMYDLGQKSQIRLRSKTFARVNQPQKQFYSNPSPILLSGIDQSPTKQQFQSIFTQSESIMKVLTRPSTSMKNPNKYFGNSLKNRSNSACLMKRNEPLNNKIYNLQLKNHKVKEDNKCFYRSVSPTFIKKQKKNMKNTEEEKKLKKQDGVWVNLKNPILALTSQNNHEYLIKNTRITSDLQKTRRAKKN